MGACNARVQHSAEEEYNLGENRPTEAAAGKPDSPCRSTQQRRSSTTVLPTLLTTNPSLSCRRELPFDDTDNDVPVDEASLDANKERRHPQPVATPAAGPTSALARAPLIKLQPRSSWTRSLEDDAEDEQAELCVLCLSDLGTEPLGVCLASDGIRTCPHYFHLACLRRVEGCHCPQCRVRFKRRVPVPSIRDDPVSWLRLVSLNGGPTANQRDVTMALKAMLPVSPDSIDSLVSSSWERWSLGEENLSVHHITTLICAIDDVLPAPKMNPVSALCHAPVESICSTGMVGHGSGKAPGSVCACGKIHILRGDRVRRGPAWTGNGTKEELGTVVRYEESNSTVLVKWDRSTSSTLQRCSWSARSSNHELVHVPFSEAACDVRGLQEKTRLSSAAAERLLRRYNYDSTRASEVFQSNSGLSEVSLRESPKLFHRVRVLPDAGHLQDWFDACPPCPCTNHNCRGGVQWSAHAERHLGREGYVVAGDKRDNTVRVEFTGRCHCQIWYPSMSVEPVYDPDTQREPRFAVSTRVECKMGSGWFPGSVNRVWWREPGWKDRPTAPYSVRLDDGRFVFAPCDSDVVVRKAKSSAA